MSQIVMRVLLNVAEMCATPSASITRDFLFALGPFAISLVLLPRRLLLGRSLLLARDRPTRALLGARVGVRALATDGQTAAVTQSAVAADVHQPLDVHVHFLPQRALDLEVLLDDLAQLVHVRIRKRMDAGIRVDSRLAQDLLRRGPADPVDVRETDFDPLLAGKIDSGDTCHALPLPQPWRCLWRGFLQITRTTPRRRTILQFSQIGLTELLTFIVPFPSCVRPAGLASRPDAFQATRVRMSGPPSVIATVCSKCADSEPSIVTIVQASCRVRTSAPPTFTIGSMAITSPGSSSSPRPSTPKFGTCGSSCRCCPMPCPTRSRTIENPADSA